MSRLEGKVAIVTGASANIGGSPAAGLAEAPPGSSKCVRVIDVESDLLDSAGNRLFGWGRCSQ